MPPKPPRGLVPSATSSGTSAQIPTYQVNNIPAVKIINYIPVYNVRTLYGQVERGTVRINSLTSKPGTLTRELVHVNWHLDNYLYLNNII